ncbi:MAG: LysM peptidoglycan-binding domain-containing protein [Planctomycetaceae bacterium]|nr:LysM peptidoglycan-binding domain-containing protein [Planctomycetaceae bacterium]
MKIVKRIAVAFVLCLALVGAYALLKKAPQLNVPSEDIHYLKEVGISASESASDEGLSGAHGSVQGAPPLVLPSGIQGSTTPPGSFGIPSTFSSPAPLLATGSESLISESPASAATTTTAKTEAPPFAVNSEAPPFAVNSQAPPFAVNSQAPPFATNSEAPPFVTANSGTVTASPFVPPTSVQNPPTPSVPLPAVPIQPEPVQSAPAQPVPVPVQSNSLQPVTIQTPIPPPVPPPSPPPDQPVTWDGPITEIIFVPSTDLSDQWRASGVMEHPAESPESLPKPVDPFLASAVSATVHTSETFVPIGQQNIALPNNNINNNVDVNNLPVNNKNVIASGNRIKRLPAVAEEPLQAEPLQVEPLKTEQLQAELLKTEPLQAETFQVKPLEVRQTVATPIDFEKNTALFASSVPINSPKRLYSQTSLLPEEKYPPFKSKDYRQTSIRTDVVFVPVPPLVNEERPMISFVPQKTEKTEKNTVQELIPVTTILPTEPEPATRNPEPETPFTNTQTVVTEVKPIDSIPFVSVESSQVAPTSENSVQQTAPMIRETVERFIKAQTVLIESGDTTKIRNAFVQLSRLYEHQELNDAEKVYMMPLLDRLALNVIYSRSAHILEPPYIIRLGDSIDSIARTFDLSPALLMKINGLTGARPLEPGTELKVVVGHFDAKISAGHRELTLILGGLYAGRFPIALGERIEHLRGEFYVNSKTDAWNEKSLMLNNGVVLYGTDRPQPGDPLATTVRFTQQDAKELFDILTEGSVIVFED